MKLEDSGIKLSEESKLKLAEALARQEVDKILQDRHERPDEQEVEQMVASRKRAYLATMREYVGKSNLNQ